MEQKSETRKELDILIDEYLKWNNVKAGELEHFALKCYFLGKSSKKCKEDKDNPYNIDYKRQTKLEL